MTDDLPYSKAKQLERSAGRRYYCPTTGEYKGRCPCPSCRGRRSRGKGKRKERAARKTLGIDTNIAQAAVGEEAWRGRVRWEVKAGARFANPVGLRLMQMEEQAEAARAVGDVRPFAGVCMPDGWGSDGVVLIRLSELAEVLEAMTE